MIIIESPSIRQKTIIPLEDHKVYSNSGSLEQQLLIKFYAEEQKKEEIKELFKELFKDHFIKLVPKDYNKWIKLIRKIHFWNLQIFNYEVFFGFNKLKKLK